MPKREASNSVALSDCNCMYACMYVQHACMSITDVGAVSISHYACLHAKLSRMWVQSSFTQCACLRCKARPRSTSGVQSRSYSLVHPSPVHAPRLTESTLIFKEKDGCKLYVRMLDSVGMLNEWTKEKFGSIICVRALNKEEMLNQQTSEICSS